MKLQFASNMTSTLDFIQIDISHAATNTTKTKTKTKDKASQQMLCQNKDCKKTDAKQTAIRF